MKITDKERPLIMGILNCTPDSFYDGSPARSLDQIIEYGLRMIDEGADMLDIGGESTRPGARTVSMNEELDRVIPVIRALRKKCSIPLSIDTTKSEVAKQAIESGVNLVNDVTALRADSGMLNVLLHYRVPVILMHSRGDSQSMQNLTQYDDVVLDVKKELYERVDEAIKGGLDQKQVLIDPGFGFAKNFNQNVLLMKNLKTFKEKNYPLVVGVSRKSFIGAMTQKENPSDRLIGSVVAGMIAALQGADILRVHDVAETKQALQVLCTMDYQL